jgi:hypothetical protein
MRSSPDANVNRAMGPLGIGLIQMSSPRSVTALSARRLPPGERSQERFSTPGLNVQAGSTSVPRPERVIQTNCIVTGSTNPVR